MIKLGKKEESLLENSYKNIYARDKKGRTVLHYAVDAKTVRLLVERGVNVNAADVGGYTALHLAVTEKHLETVRELIKSGANVNSEEYGSKCTPLHLACMVGEKEIVEELVKAGGEIEQADECGMTAMDYVKNSKEIAEVLEKEMDRIEKLFMRGWKHGGRNRKESEKFREETIGRTEKNMEEGIWRRSA